MGMKNNKHAKAWTDDKGLEHLNFDVCERKAKKMTDAELEYSIKDALAAVEANPDCGIAGRWTDEASVFGMELERRKAKAD